MRNAGLEEAQAGINAKSWLIGKDCDAGTDWGAGGEGDNRGWDGWMASLTQWTWVWVNSGSWWWTGRPGVLQFMGSQRVRHDWTELNWKEVNFLLGLPFPSPGNLPNPGIEPTSSALAGRFFTTEPPGKPISLLDLYENWTPHETYKQEKEYLSSYTGGVREAWLGINLINTIPHEVALLVITLNHLGTARWEPEAAHVERA